MLGNGVGPIGSVHVSATRRPTLSSRSFMAAIFVFSSLILIWTFFRDKLQLSLELEVTE